MYEKLLAQMSEQSQKMAQPINEITTLTVDYIEKLSAFQVNAVKAYTDLGLDQLRNMTSVKDAESLQAYVAKQREMATEMGKKVADDAKALAQLGEVFAEDIQNLAKKDLARLTEFTAPFMAAAQKK